MKRLLYHFFIKQNLRKTIKIVVFFCFQALSTVVFAQTPTTDNWETIFSGSTGPSGDVYSVVTDANGNIYVAGDFLTAGGVNVNYVAKWDGSSWTDLAGGMNAPVYCLAFDSNGNLYAGGDFTEAGGVSANHIAKWNGNVWKTLGSGTDRAVLAIAIDNNNFVYAGGKFTSAGGNDANRIAKWNGSSWSKLGSGMNSYVFTLKFDNSGNLYAGGSFTQIGGLIAKRIAKWNGVSWSALGTGMDNTVRAIEFDASGNIFAGGAFETADGNTVNHLARWNGSTWVAVGTGTNDDVRALLRNGSDIYIGGNFTTANGSYAPHLAKWNGSSLTSFGSNFNNNIYSLNFSQSGDLIAAGTFTLIDNSPFSNIAIYSGSSWLRFGSLDNALNDRGYAVVYDSINNVTYIGGEFTSAGGTVVNQIVKWDGNNFTTLGTGFNGTIYDLIVDNSGNLYAGGDFTTASGVSANRIAKWNGLSWSALGSGMNDAVYGLYIDNFGNLYAGGKFTTAGGNTANYFAKWNGSSWSGMGNFDSYVRSICADNSGNIYAAGEFSIVDGNIVNYIAEWTGSSWSALGSGTNNVIFSIVFDKNNTLYAGGQFTTAGGKTALRIAKWDGSQWSAIAGGANSTVYTLETDRNNFLYAGGSFTTIDGKQLPYIAKWDGTQWLQIGDGMNNTVRDIDVNFTGQLYTTGDFTTAGGHSSAFFGIYTFYPTIEIYGNQTQILNNDLTPDYADSTDFDTIRACNSTTTRTYVIHNTGDWPMNIAGISLSGDNPTDFHLANIPTLIGVYDSLSFDVTFGTAEAGFKSAIITTNSDARHNPSFVYKIQGMSLDTLKPIFTAQDFTVFLDENGNASINDTDIVVSASDNCDLTDTILSNYDFDCSFIDTIPDSVVVTVYDENGNFSTDTVIITVKDTLIPQLSVIQKDTITLDSFGIASVRAADVVLSAVDNCHTDTLFAENDFDCSFVDSTFNLDVILQDTYGNADTQAVTITIIDTIKPEIRLTDTIIEIDSNGYAILRDTSFEKHIYENCELQEVTFSTDTFYCADAGVHSVDITAVDINGNQSTKAVNITVADSIKPFLALDDTTVYLDENGQLDLYDSPIVDSVWDNCQIVDTIFSLQPVSCANLGLNIVTVQLVDNHGNITTDSVAILVKDTLAPVPDTALLTDQTAQCSITLTPPTATDNCSGTVTATTDAPLTYNEQGTYTVTWIYTDESGNTSYQNQRVIILDSSEPVPELDSLPVLSGVCDYSVNEFPYADDNCNGEIQGTTSDTLYYDFPGQYLITWKYDDGLGNVSEQLQTVEVINEPPEVYTQDITVMLDVYGNAEITPDQIDDGSYDDCGIDTMTLDKYKFTLDDLGENTVTLTVTDNVNNSSSETAIVTIVKYPDLQIPNYISPNGDNVNDRWTIIGVDHLIGYTLYIYNQSNELVYQTVTYDNSWDGTRNGVPLPEGTYYYIFVKDSDKISGYITLVK